MRKICILSAAAVAALFPVAASASSAETYYERALMSMAGERCGLFTANIAAALASSAAQARGAALRAGETTQELAAIEGRARIKANQAGCRSADLLTAAARVRTAFEGYSRMAKMKYPGEIAGWQAERISSRTSMVWVLSQQAQVKGAKTTFGITRRDSADSLVAVAQFSGKARPYAARLVMRDPAKAPRAYLDRRGVAAGKSLPLFSRMAPASASQTFMAEAQGTPDPMIAPANGKPAIAYRFPHSAVAALSELDPREAIEIEFLFSSVGRDKTVKAFVEVGDFAAGRAFLSVAQR